MPLIRQEGMLKHCQVMLAGTLYHWQKQQFLQTGSKQHARAAPNHTWNTCCCMSEAALLSVMEQESTSCCGCCCSCGKVCMGEGKQPTAWAHGEDTEEEGALLDSSSSSGHRAACVSTACHMHTVSSQTCAAVNTAWGSKQHQATGCLSCCGGWKL